MFLKAIPCGFGVQTLVPLERVCFGTCKTHVFKGNAMCFVVQTLVPLERVCFGTRKTHVSKGNSMCFAVQTLVPLERVCFGTHKTHVFKGNAMCFVVQTLIPLESLRLATCKTLDTLTSSCSIGTFSRQNTYPKVVTSDSPVSKKKHFDRVCFPWEWDSALRVVGDKAQDVNYFSHTLL